MVPLEHMASLRLTALDDFCTQPPLIKANPILTALDTALSGEI